MVKGKKKSEIQRGKRNPLDVGTKPRADDKPDKALARQGQPDFLDRLRALRNADQIGTIGSVLDGRDIQRYEAMGDTERADRERVALAKSKRKATRIAPLYNKGGYQFLGDSDDLTGVGRKK